MHTQIAFARQLSSSMWLSRREPPRLTPSLLWGARATGLWYALYTHWVQFERLPQLDLAGLEPWLHLARATQQRLRGYKNQWRNQTVVCVGNGPSINHTQIECLNDAYVIGTNRAYKLLEQVSPRHFHLAIQDNHRLQELQEVIAGLSCPLHIGSWSLSPDMPPPPWVTAQREQLSVYLPKVKWVWENDQLKPEGTFDSGFSPDPTRGVYYGCSVIFSAIQFAAYFGAKRIVCIGIDMDFSQGTNFVPGVRNIWPSFNYDEYAKPMFIRLRQALAARGIELINATPGGKVEELQRLSLAEALGR